MKQAVKICVNSILFNKKTGAGYTKTYPYPWSIYCSVSTLRTLSIIRMIINTTPEYTMDCTILNVSPAILDNIYANAAPLSNAHTIFMIYFIYHTPNYT